MLPLPGTLRASAELSRHDLRAKDGGSGNECEVPWPHRKSAEGFCGPDFPPAVASEHAAVATRLYAKVDPNGPEMRSGLGRCWIWTAYTCGTGKCARPAMGWRAKYGNRPVYTSRVVWEIHVGDIPDGRQINHHCDNGLCVRVDHLYLGTQVDNLQDASRRGRLHVPRVTSALTPADRAYIHSLPPRRGLVTELAAHYGVSKSCIGAIRNGRFLRVPDGLLQAQPRQSVEGGGAFNFGPCGLNSRDQISIVRHGESLPHASSAGHLHPMETR